MNKAAIRAYVNERDEHLPDRDRARRGSRGWRWTVAWWLRMHLFRRVRKCPKCGAVGTYKAFGGRKAHRKWGDRLCRRLLCKFCGYYDGEDEAFTRAYADMDRGCWLLPSFWTVPVFNYRRLCKRMITPAEELGKRVGPWVG